MFDCTRLYIWHLIRLYIWHFIRLCVALYKVVCVALYKGVCAALYKVVCAALYKVVCGTIQGCVWHCAKFCAGRDGMAKSTSPWICQRRVLDTMPAQGAGYYASAGCWIRSSTQR